MEKRIYYPLNWSEFNMVWAEEEKIEPPKEGQLSNAVMSTMPSSHLIMPSIMDLNFFGPQH